MIVKKQISLLSMILGSGHHIIWLSVLMTSVTLLYHFQIISIRIPWIPVSIVGTAVAFYVGFKNNQSYDRMWEARKIWGGIVNDSRSWGMMVDGYITNIFTQEKSDEKSIHQMKKRLIYRHIAWLYAHRSQLLVATEWEHISQSGKTGDYAKIHKDKFGIGLLDDEITIDDLSLFLPEDEKDRLINYANTATQIINQQSRDLTSLREKDLIDDFRHIALESLLMNFYTLQGKNERIKKFPLPRQYASISRYFVGIFITLLPFSIVPEVIEATNWGIWLCAPIGVLIGWVYVMMEVIGDYSENPFQGMANDIPMMSLCRTIEIDLKEMLGETDLPPTIKAKEGILM